MTTDTVIDASEEVKSEALIWPDRARALSIRDQTSYVQAGELLKGIKALRAKIADVFDAHISRAHELHKALVGEKKAAEAPLTEAEQVLKHGLVRYSDEQERIRKAEEARLAALARQQEEERRKAEEAAALAEAAELEALGLDEQAEAVVAEAMAAPAMPAAVITLPSFTPKVAGISYREQWRADVTNLRSLVQAAALDERYLGLLQVNQVALNGMVRALKGNLQIPGVRVWSERVAAASGR